MDNEQVLPESDHPENLCETFRIILSTKLTVLCLILILLETVSIFFSRAGHSTPTTLDVLADVTSDQLMKVIMASPTKSCMLDTIPTWLLKKTLSEHQHW